MVALMKSSNPLTDLERIIQITKSSETIDHLKSSLKCFFLWDKKYLDSSFTKDLKSQISNKKAVFWSIFKTKESEFSPYSDRKK